MDNIIKVNLELETVEAMANRLGFEVVPLPINDLKERQGILERLLNDVIVSRVKQIVKDSYNQVKDQLIDTDDVPYNEPTHFSLSFEQEYNDEGGTDPELRYISLYDIEGVSLDLDVCVTYKYTNWRGEEDTGEDDCDYFIREELRNQIGTDTLYNEVGEMKIAL